MALRTMNLPAQDGSFFRSLLFFLLSFFFPSFRPRISFFFSFFFSVPAQEGRFFAVYIPRPPTQGKIRGPKCLMPARPRGRTIPGHYPCDIYDGLRPTAYGLHSICCVQIRTAVVFLTSIRLLTEWNYCKCCILQTVRVYQVTISACTIAQQQ